MSMAPEDTQRIELTIPEIQTLRGALNVAEELLVLHPEMAERFPIVDPQRDVIVNLSRRLTQRVIGAGDDPDPERTIGLTLTPEMAQAVRDVTGTMEDLHQNPAGREVLVEIGFLRSADQPIDQDELDDLMTIQDMIDPTGVRPEPTVTTDFPPGDTDEGLLARIDRIRSITGLVIERASESGTLGTADPTEEAVDRGVKAVLPGTGADCGQLLVSLAELAQLDAQVVAATDDSRPGQAPRPDQGLIEQVQDARRLIMSRMGERGCAPEGQDFRSMRNAFLAIHDPIGDDEATDLETRTFNAITEIRNAFQDPRRGP